jgi:flagellar motor switch protein FliN
MVQSPQDPSGGSEQPLSQEDIDAALNEASPNKPAAPAAAASVQSPPAAAAPQVDQSGRPFDQFASAMAEAIASEPGPSAKPAGAPADGTVAVSLPDFAGGNGKATALELDKLQMLEDVQLQVRIELGRTRMLVQDVLRLDQGSVVELDKLAGDPVDIYVNERLVAHGEVLVLNDNFCVRVNEIVSSPQETMA